MARNVAMVRVIDFRSVLANTFVSMLMPASKVMMQMATTPISGDREMKNSFLKYPSKGPRRMPKPSSQMMSGIFVFV